MASCGEVEHFSSFGQPCPSNHHSRPGWALQHSSDWAPQSNKVLLLEPEILPHFDKQWIVPDHHGTFLFHSSAMHAAGPLPCLSPAQEIKNKLEDLFKKKKRKIIIAHHLKVTSPEIGLFPVMLFPVAILGKSVDISHVISDCYHASSDLFSVFDTRAYPKGIYISIIAI